MQYNHLGLHMDRSGSVPNSQRDQTRSSYLLALVSLRKHTSNTGPRQSLDSEEKLSYQRNLITGSDTLGNIERKSVCLVMVEAAVTEEGHQRHTNMNMS